ncbi:SDR family oxidoreductase [bacterium]|nr:SDR family oxidoreductase [bacterium]
MPTVLFTGFPGFLGSELLPRVLLRAPELTATCLIQPKFVNQALARKAQLEARHPELEGRILLEAGDLRAPGLGLDATLKRETVEIYHLAAIYDLSVPREPAMQVNVEGTRHLLDWAEGCPGLSRMHYVSTCYVSGRHDGHFRETDLDVGQAFNNFYEETKFLAEVEVQRRMQGGLPATVYRPAIVVGDSRTGATQKYDGPYFLIRWILRQKGLALVPVVADPRRIRLNVVPRDFVIEAIAHLSGRPETVGGIYQLADPNALSVDALLRALERATGRKILRVPLDPGLAKKAIDRVPGLYRLMEIPSAAVDYFAHPTHYDTTQVQAALHGSGLAVPPLSSYLARLVRFVQGNEAIGSEAMA